MYKPNYLFNHVLDLTGIPSDRQLAERLGVNKSRISNIRNNKEPFTAGVLIALHELTGIPTLQLKEMAGL